MSEILEGIDSYSAPSFSLKNRIMRLLWNFTCLLLFRPSLWFMNGWRSGLLRLFGAKIGRGCTVKATVKIWAPWNLEMEDLACLADNVTVYSMAMIKLGKKSIVSQGAHLCAGTHDFESQNFQLYSKPITIGADAWVCAEAFVGPGVTVGEGAVLGARGVAMKDLPAWTVCAGNPCKPIRARVMKGA